MRKLIVSNLISLDGYASGAGGDVMALPFDATFSDYNLELMQAADTLVSGATTYRGFVSYWPPIADDPAQPEVERAICRHLDRKPTPNGRQALREPTSRHLDAKGTTPTTRPPGSIRHLRVVCVVGRRRPVTAPHHLLLSAGSCEERGDDIGGVPVKGASGPVVAPRRS